VIGGADRRSALRKRWRLERISSWEEALVVAMHEFIKVLKETFLIVAGCANFGQG